MTVGIDSKSNRYKNLLSILLNLLTMRQGEIETLDGYLQRFKSNIQTVELVGGTECLIPAFTGLAPAEAKDVKKEKFMAIMFLCCSDHKAFGGLLDRFHKQMNIGNDQYPQPWSQFLICLSEKLGRLEKLLA